MTFIKNYISANCKTGLVLHIQNQFIKIHIKPATVLSTAFQTGMTLVEIRDQHFDTILIKAKDGEIFKDVFSYLKNKIHIST